MEIKPFMRSIIFCLIVLVVFACSMTNVPKEKINGVSFVAASHQVDSTHVKPVVSVNANYAAVMPFGFIRELNSPEIVHNTERQWFGETKAGTHQYIEELRKKGIKIMIKPQQVITGHHLQLTLRLKRLTVKFQSPSQDQVLSIQ